MPQYDSLWERREAHLEGWVITARWKIDSPVVSAELESSSSSEHFSEIHFSCHIHSFLRSNPHTHTIQHRWWGQVSHLPHPPGAVKGHILPGKEGEWQFGTRALIKSNLPSGYLLEGMLKV